MRPPVLGALLYLLHGAAHRRRQPGETVLDDVVGGPFFKRVHRLLLAQSAGNQNKRQGRPFGMGDLQCGPAVEFRQLEVRNNQIKPAAFQRRHKSRPVVHQSCRASDASLFQRCLTSAASSGLSSRWSMWSGDFIWAFLVRGSSSTDACDSAFGSWLFEEKEGFFSWDGKVKCRAAVHYALGPCPPAVALDDALDIGQADARALELLLAVQALKHAE